jgi:hypothetical protein
MVAAADLFPPLASVATTSQFPALMDAVYVVVTAPLALVVPNVGLTVPQVAAGLARDGATLKLTRSPGTAAPPATAPVVTVAVTLTVSVPFALIFAGEGLVVSATKFVCAGLVVWSRTPDPFPPVAASVAVTVQKPIVLDDV